MTNDNRVLWAQLIGLVAIVLARFGIDLDTKAQADILAGLSAFGLVLTALLAKTSAAKPTNTESGFARPSFLTLLVAISLIAFSACSMQPPQTPRQTLLAAYTTAESVADAVAIAKQSGHISDTQRDLYVEQLKQANELLNAARTLLANDPASTSINGSNAAASLKAAQTILLSLQKSLPKEST